MTTTLCSLGPLYAYVGSRTTRERRARGEGLSVYRVDAASGALERIQLVGGLVNPSYLVVTRDGTRLYCVHGDRSEVSAFAIDRTGGQANGRLSLINQQDTGGRNLVHLALDATERHLFVTNHLGASVMALPIGADGSLGPVSASLAFEGPPGPHRSEQPHAKPHGNFLSPDGRFLVVPDKGVDRVFCVRVDADGRLLPAEAPYVAAREGAGPRHAVFHPTLPRLYVVNELDSTVTTYRFDGATGALAPLHWLPTLPASFTGNSRAAGIAVDPTGCRLYASNRGHDSIALFQLDAASGLPSFVETVPTLGRTPRAFTLSPDGRHLFALNEDSDSIVAFDVDPASGRLSHARPVAACGSPVCMVFA